MKVCSCFITPAVFYRDLSAYFTSGQRTVIENLPLTHHCPPCIALINVRCLLQSVQKTNKFNEEVTTISGDLKGSVLLPCPCSHRDLDKDLRWQKEQPHLISVVKYSKNHSVHGDDTYRGRVNVSLHHNSSDCSLRIANITAEDQGKYRCSFWKEERYSKKFVYLNVTGESLFSWLPAVFLQSFQTTNLEFNHFNLSHLPPARYNVCLTNDSASRFFRCNASGRQKDAVIEWKSDGQPLTDSAETRITHSNTVEAPPGHYRLISELTTKLPSTPTCDVKAIDFPIVVHHECPPQNGKGDPQYKG